MQQLQPFYKFGILYLEYLHKHTAFLLLIEDIFCLKGKLDI
ncbi:hypothetical protein SLCC85_20122 [Listeria monocytogenes]|nr:hypothetical protein SLCC85_20122 [Listeria monocytogenes]